MSSTDALLDTFTRNNDQSRKRLLELLNRLGDRDLGRIVNHGWTVTMGIAHLAFWDNFAVARIQYWESHGHQKSTMETEAINDALRPMLEAISGKRAVEMARAACEAIDEKVSSIQSELATLIINNGQERVLHRALHRKEHIDEIEAAIGSS